MKIERRRINQMMTFMLDLPAINVENRSEVARAIVAHSAGMDFADAMHVCGCPSDQTFVTFDRDLVRRAKKYFPDANVELAV